MKILSMVTIFLILVGSIVFFVNEQNVDGLEKIQKDCENGDMEECSALGGIYKFGITLEQDTAKATELYERACNGNLYSACTQLTLMHDVISNFKKAEELLSKSCNNKDFAGCVRLGSLYQLSYLEEKSRIYYEKACDAGDWVSCNEVGEHFYGAGRYRYSVGGTRNKEASKKYFEKACDFGKDDIGVKFDLELREKWQGACIAYNILNKI